MLCCTSWHCCNWTNCGPTASRSETIGRSPFDRQGFQGFQAPIALGAQRLWMLEVSMSWLRRKCRNGSWDKGSPFQATGSMRPWWDHVLRTVPGTMAGNLEASQKIIKNWDQACRFGTSGCRDFSAPSQLLVSNWKRHGLSQGSWSIWSAECDQKLVFFI